MSRDKQVEFQRYDQRAQSLLATGFAASAGEDAGALAVPPPYRAPYVCYESYIRRLVRADQEVLELGAGTGLHTGSLAGTGARVVATDISSHSLQVIAKRIKGRVTTAVADMESLPFEENSFDVVASAGSLSYGNPLLVDVEVHRVLKLGGVFLCVDSLAHNPMYRLNRWINCKRGQRTKSTLSYMPTEERIASIAGGFHEVSVHYFGAISFLMPVLGKVVGRLRAAQFSDAVDRLVQTRRSAFKFVLIAQGHR